MIQHISTEVVPLTKALASRVAATPNYQGERALQRRRLGYLAQRLRDGLFYPPRWSLVRVGGTEYRVNGQHSSAMLTENIDLFPDGMSVVIDRFEADSMRDVADLFSQFDNKASVRSRMEIVNAHARVHVELDAMSSTTLSACVSGMSYALCDGKGLRSYADDQRAALTHEHMEFVQWVHEFAKARVLSRATVIAAIFRTYEVNREHARMFWTWVRDETHPDSQHSTRTLAKFLSLNTNKVGMAKWEPRAFYVKCLHAWNAYRMGATTALKYRHDKPVPSVR